MGRMPRRLGGGMGFWGMCLRGRRCGGDRGGAFCDGESLVGWDGSAKRTLDFDIFFFQQVRIIALDGKLYEGEMGWAGVGVPFCLERIWRYKMDAYELAAVEGLLE